MPDAEGACMPERFHFLTDMMWFPHSCIGWMNDEKSW